FSIAYAVAVRLAEPTVIVKEIISANKIIESILRFIDIKGFLFRIYKNEKHIILVLFPKDYGILIT
ncbi:MAG: hypothetical protein M3156_04860, partial [Thermoproteota archaeon]|nr:hypothetical protein [Thermoproteota archaeon]